MEWIFRLDQLKQAAAQLWQVAGDAKVFAVHGKMGAGKTTLIHSLCDIKNVKDVIGSPTFSIINEYVYGEGNQENKIFHVDLYRLTGEDEAIQAGVEDCLYSGSICFIEWPEKIASHLPVDSVHIYIEAIDEQTRRLIIKDN